MAGTRLRPSLSSRSLPLFVLIVILFISYLSWKPARQPSTLADSDSAIAPVSDSTTKAESDRLKDPLPESDLGPYAGSASKDKTPAPPPSSTSSSSSKSLTSFHYDTNPNEWSKIIWQTSRIPTADFSDEDHKCFDSWLTLNPGYKHELMTDAWIDEYVAAKYNNTEAGQTYNKIQDYIMRTDLIRYMVLLADGGVYNDLDVSCEKPIDTWLPKEYAQDESVNVLLGVEVDNKLGPDGRTFEGGQDLFELVNWTIMAKPGNAFLEYLVRRIIDNVQRLLRTHKPSSDEMQTWTPSVQEVLETTGPEAMTAAFFEYASSITASKVTYKNFTKMTEPKFVGGVLVLPIHAFGAGHQVEWAGFKPNPAKALVHHYFKGSWKEDHFLSGDTHAHAPVIYGPDNNKNDTKATQQEEEEEEEEVVIVEEKVKEVQTAVVYKHKDATTAHPLPSDTTGWVISGDADDGRFSS